MLKYKYYLAILFMHIYIIYRYNPQVLLFWGNSLNQIFYRWINFYNLWFAEKSCVFFWFSNFLSWGCMWLSLAVYLVSFISTFFTLPLLPRSLLKSGFWFFVLPKNKVLDLYILAVIFKICSCIYQFLLRVVFCFLSFFLTLNNNFFTFFKAYLMMKAFKTLKFPLRTVSVFKVISHWSKFFFFSSPSKWFVISFLISLLQIIFSSMFVNFQIFTIFKNLFTFGILLTD